ncbi:hypothetical protein AB0J83_08260, partial [Actinoplanes sp. NPDC049596]
MSRPALAGLRTPLVYLATAVVPAGLAVAFIVLRARPAGDGSPAGPSAGPILYHLLLAVAAAVAAA